jgi:carbonic anhydrase
MYFSVRYACANMELFALDKVEDIPQQFQDTPIGRLIEYHNLGRAKDEYVQAELLIGMCMDSRKHLRIPDNFAFIIRTGGANLRYSEFKISYAIGFGGVKAIALIGHNNCGMVNLEAKRQQFIDGLVENAGWDREAASEHFDRYSLDFEIGDEVNFLRTEARRLRLRYPKILVMPLLYNLETNRLFGIIERKIPT